MAQKRSGSSSSRAKTSARAKSSSSRSASTRKAAASKGGKARARQRTATKAATKTRGPQRAAPAAPVSRPRRVAELRDALRKNLIRPMEMVMISRERIEEVLGEAVDQGRVTARDAQRITSGLVKRGQKQTSDVLKDLENLLDQGRSGIEDRASGARGRAVPPRLPGARPGRPRSPRRRRRGRTSRSRATTT